MADDIVIICGPESFFLDDVKENCVNCGSEVYHRPHSPHGTYICLQCLLKLVAKNPQFKGEFRVTKETVKEVLEELKMRKTKH